ncbi:ParB/Srx family N-terminal domain-containing protein [Gardnerella vaginalis]|uniref:ParB/Srx family N-terminal domain-containing protein n=1 Tax=Gardnerella vaginalis TaxID=2702 RepID=UPI000E210BC5|nr:ParB/Srx family N-terminal domain-containing protein [Gardnerella vaginalis]RDW99354.1 chromosome partitioning protein ParB [Gardnerella vaginalis]
MDLLKEAAANMLRKTGEKKKLSIRNQVDDKYDVYEIPLECLYYNDQNGRINTMYKKYSSENGVLTPEAGDSKYNEIFEKFIFESNVQAMKDTKLSIDEKSQQEPGVVLPDGRVIDGNRRFTALRMLERERKIPQFFNAVILPLDQKLKIDEKIIKELELDLQLGREEKVGYDPIDRIFDVYNTVKIEKIMNEDEYKKASGAKSTKGINRDIRLAELIIKFIEIVSPGGNSIDKFYLARDLKLDGPIEEIEGTINKLKSDRKEEIKDDVLVYLIASKIVDNQNDSTRIMRDLKNNVIKDNDRLQYFLKSADADDKIDNIMDSFKANPIKSANDLKKVIEQSDKAKNSVYKLISTTEKLINKGKIENERTKALIELENVRDSLSDIAPEDFSELTVEENVEARNIISEINDILYKLKRKCNYDIFKLYKD